MSRNTATAGFSLESVSVIAAIVAAFSLVIGFFSILVLPQVTIGREPVENVFGYAEDVRSAWQTAKSVEAERDKYWNDRVGHDWTKEESLAWVALDQSFAVQMGKYADACVNYRRRWQERSGLSQDCEEVRNRPNLITP